MECWKRRSFIEMAVIIILLTAIPFLLGMIIVYALYATVWNESGSCGVFCCNLDEAEKIKRHQQPDYINYADYESVPYWEKRSSADFPRYDNKMGGYYGDELSFSVAALLENLYEDEDKVKIFKCAVVVLSDSWALTSENCLSSGLLTIRIDSDFWAKDGVLKRIRKGLTKAGVESPKLALLNFDRADFTEAVPVAEMFDKRVYGFTWEGNRLDLPLSQRKKFKNLRKFTFELLQKDDCANFGIPTHVTCYLVPRNNCSNSKNSFPLINSRNELVGIHLETICVVNTTFAVVSYLDVGKYKTWINKTIITQFNYYY